MNVSEIPNRFCNIQKFDTNKSNREKSLLDRLIRLRGRVFHKAILLMIYINRKVREQSQITGLFLRSGVVGQ